MKKKFLSVITMAVLLMWTGCSNKEADNVDNTEEQNSEGKVASADRNVEANFTSEQKALGDSISMVIGEIMGQHFATRNLTLPEKLDIERYLQGVESVVKADTSMNLSYQNGQMEALQTIIGLKLQMREGAPFNSELFMKSMRAHMNDSLETGANARMNRLMSEMSEIQQEKAREKSAKEGEKNKLEGEKFLAENAQRDGVITTPSGLQYEILTEGNGPKPAADSHVEVHYTGKLLDGTVFDSSVDRGTPAHFGVNQVIAGWTEALQLMPVGSKWRLFIPSELAYGERGAGSDIGPNATLIFDVELLDIE